jgi:soluble lytic murein transglycosylase-like protein
MATASLYDPRSVATAGKAKLYGANYSLRIVYEAKRVGIPVSALFALIEKETNFKNIFGHDHTVYYGAGRVTKAKYLAYKRIRGHNLMQGVGPAQLTWWEFQDKADKLGGSWSPKWNIHVGAEVFAEVFHKTHGSIRTKLHAAAKAYNGSEGYADDYMLLFDKWHKRLK